MKVKPRFTSEMVAVRISSDLLAEAGSYLIVGPEDTIEVMTKGEFDRLFEVSDGERGKLARGVSEAIPSTPQMKNGNGHNGRPHQRYRIGTEQQIVLAFGPATDDAFLKNVTASALSRILNKTPQSLLLDRMAKLIRAKKISARADGDHVVYNLTPDGEMMSREVRNKRHL